MVEDKLLIWRFKSGDTAALARIYEKYKVSLLRIATALLNDASAAEDIVQDVFVCFAQSSDRFKLAGNLKSYLATCVANRARNMSRDRQREAVVDLAGAGPLPTDTRGPGSWIIWTEELRIVNDAMAQLPYEQREVVSLHLQGDMKFKTIAKLQNISVNTVQSRYRYGLQKLRSLLNHEVSR